MKLFVVLDPITSLLLHLLHDLVSLVTDKVALDDLSGSLEVVHELHASLPPLLHGLLHLIDGVAHLILVGHRATCHAQEVELLLPQFFDLLARQNTLDAFLNEESRSILFLFGSLFLDKALTNLLVKLGLNTLLLEGLDHEHDTVTSLTTSLVLLDQTDGVCDAKLDRVWVLHDLDLWLSGLIELVHVCIHELNLLIEWLRGLLLLLLAIIILLLLLFRLLLLLFLLAAGVFLDFLLEFDVNWDPAILAEVSRHWDFDD